jgi:hypothetical protein
MLYLAYPAPHTPWLPSWEFEGMRCRDVRRFHGDGGYLDQNVAGCPGRGRDV